MVPAEERIETIFENGDFLAFYKPKGLATVPLRKDVRGDSLLIRASVEHPEILAVSSPFFWEGGIIHRLDTPTSGIVIAARTDEAFTALTKLQRENRIEKHYIASVHSTDSLPPGFEAFPYTWRGGRMTITSRFRPYGEGRASVRPVLENRRFSGPEYTTLVMASHEKDTFECVITKGFRHQIRSHLAWSAHPIDGDVCYGSKVKGDLLLEAVRVIFPWKGETVTISL